MKKFQRLLALLIALMMIFSVVTMASADDETNEGGDTTSTKPVNEPPFTLTINNTAPNHTYDAYQIFAGDLSDDATTLSTIKWGSSIRDARGLIQRLATDTKEIVLAGGRTTLSATFIQLTAMDEYKDIVDLTKTVTDEVLNKFAAKVAEILGTISNDSAVLDRFAEVVGEVVYKENGDFDHHTYLGNCVASSTAITTGVTTTTGYEITGLPAGYFLIKDQDGTVSNEGDFYSKYMVRVVKSASINVKGEGVKVTKTVNDTVDGTFSDYEDGHTNETLYFKLEGTLPANLMSYDEYYYKFVDTMAAGLTYNRIETIYIENEDGQVAQTIYPKENTDVEDANVTFVVPEKEGETTVNKDYLNLAFPTATNGETVPTFTLEFVDLFKIVPTLLPSHKVIVKYSAYMNRNALIADANINKVTLDYSNNPNGQGTGTTVPSNAETFTYQVKVDKYDSADQKIKLDGVEFILYYQDTVGGQVHKHYAMVITEEMVAAGAIINGKQVTEADVGVVYDFTETRVGVDIDGNPIVDEDGSYILDASGNPNVVNPTTKVPYEGASVLDTDTNGSIVLKGLNAGIFYLEETKTKSGYNMLDTPVQIEIIPTYTAVTETDTHTVSVQYKVDGMSQDASNTVGVRNSKGATLPSTGGMGTTIFYIVGAILVVGAGVILITKKRMANEK